ncbi:hypothetical protein PTSG_11389, partial [Salpingoeca rosetta]
MYEDAAIVPSPSQGGAQNLVELSRLVLSAGATWLATDTMNTTTFKVDDLELQGYSEIRVRNATIASTKVNMHVDSIITAASLGYAPNTGPGTVQGNRYGASHAGCGGRGSTSVTRSQPFGSIFAPVTMGPGGSTGSQGQAGRGGGAVRISADTVLLEGRIDVSGESVSVDGGGGAGGSLWITATTLHGFGSLAADGGDGGVYNNLRGGGGSGGIISLSYDETQSRFFGTISAVGGDGFEVGAAGILYTERTQADGNTYTVLELNNGGRTPPSFPAQAAFDFDDVSRNPAISYLSFGDDTLNLPGTGTFVYSFDEVRVGDGAQLAMYPAPGQPSALTATHLLGTGGTARLVIGRDQRVTLPPATSEDEERDIRLDLFLQEGSIADLPATVELRATMVSQGQLNGLEHLLVGKDGVWKVASTGYTSGQTPGTYEMMAVTVMYQGTVISLSPLSTRLAVDSLNVHFGATYDFAGIPEPTRDAAHVDVEEAGRIEGSACFWHPNTQTCGCQDQPIDDLHSETECPERPERYCEKGPDCDDFFADVCRESNCTSADRFQHTCKVDPFYEPVFSYDWQPTTCADQTTEDACLSSKCYHFYDNEPCPTGIKLHNDTSYAVYNPCREGTLIVDERNVTFDSFYYQLTTEEKHAVRQLPYNVTLVDGSLYSIVQGACNYSRALEQFVAGELSGNASADVAAIFESAGITSDFSAANLTADLPWPQTLGDRRLYIGHGSASACVDSLRPWYTYIETRIHEQTYFWNETMVERVNYTYWNMTYAISCDYRTGFTLSPGENCFLEPGEHEYDRLELQGNSYITVQHNATTPTVVRVRDLVTRGGSRIVSNGVASNPKGTPTTAGRGGFHGGFTQHDDDVYGSVTAPLEAGGAASSGSGGLGGGVVRLIVGEKMTHDGTIQANGASGSVGGGAGGSVYITTPKLHGVTGTIQANGGTGTYGGSGGRIAVEVTTNNEYRFEGTLAAYGGGNGAGPGTVFLRDQVDGVWRDRVTIAGEGSTTLRDPEYGDNVTVAELMVMDGATFIVQPGAVVTATTVTGNGGGLVDLLDNSELRVAEFEDARCLVNFKVGTGAVLDLVNTTLLLGTRNPALEVYGQVLGPYLSLGPNTRAVVHDGAQLDTLAVVVGKSARLQLDEGAVVGTDGDATTYVLDSLVLQDDSVMRLGTAHPILRIGYFQMGYNALLDTPDSGTRNFTFICDNAFLGNGANIGLSGFGELAGPGAAGANSGASHGGPGSGPQRSEVTYGSTMWPRSYGSGANGVARGGGVISFHVAGELLLNGELVVNGDSASTGAGSGGSILIEADVLKGHGSMTANGGRVTGAGAYGGSGGRISVQTPDQSQFAGEFRALGGGGSTSAATAGAPGTIYRAQLLFGIPTTSVVFKNSGHRPQLPTSFGAVDVDGNPADVVIDRLAILQAAEVSFEPASGVQGPLPRSSCVVSLVMQLLAPVSRPLSLPSAFVVEPSAELVLPQRVTVPGTSVSPTLDLQGLLTGGNQMVVSNGATVRFRRTSHTATGEGAGSYTFIDPPGQLSFRYFEVAQDGQVTIEGDAEDGAYDGVQGSDVPLQQHTRVADTAMRFSAVDFLLTAGGQMDAGHVIFTSTTFTVGYGAVLSATGLGHAFGQGFGGGLMLGTGGSYGGASGPVSGTHVDEHGCVYWADRFGSGGGNTNGGRGGGFIRVETQDASIDGRVAVDGAHAGGSSGSGSGGSFYMRVSDTMHGVGTISVAGGDATCSTCGSAGSGGRIVIEVAKTNHFQGSLLTRGGSGRLGHGASGTAYVTSQPTGYPFRQLFLENAKRDTDPYTRLSGCAGATAYAFDEVHMADSAKLSMTDDTQATLTLTIVDLVSDESTTILVHDSMRVFLETSTSRNVIARVASNIFLRAQGELLLPPAVQFVGPSSVIAGQLTNAQRVYVQPHGVLHLDHTVRTAQYDEASGYGFISQPGEFKFGALELGTHSQLVFGGNHTHDISLAAGRLVLGFASRLSAHRLTAGVGELVLQPQSVIDLDEHGYEAGAGPCPGSDAVGAGHGGFAGGAGASCAYGDFGTPDMPGSGGLTVHGGGLVHIVSSLELRLAGTITAAGQDATVGAGAGGSIFIQASKLTGTGDLAARGGSASSAGSGAGGRIAVVVDTLSQYAGEVYTSGGHGSNDVGAPGTFHFVNARLGSTEVSLQVDNENGAAHADTPTTVIEQTGMTDFVFDRLDIFGGARVEFVGSSLRAVELGGDKTGHLLVQNGQRMWVAFSTPRSTFRLVVAHDFTVDEGGELILPQSVAVIGHALHVNGKLTNANRLTIGEGATVVLGERMVKASLDESASTFNEPVYNNVDTPNEVTIDELELLSGSTLSTFAGGPLTLRAGAIHVRTGATIHQEHLELDVGVLNIERGASIDCSGVETQVQPGLCSQCGAGHASHGGVASDVQAPSAYFGTFYAPTTTGYRGSQGGNGGGHIFIQAIDVFVDGVLAVDGASGGGSGGSILIEVGDELRGTGVIRADGGNGYTGGSGGRVAVHAAFDLQYSGTMQALGGTGTAGLDAAHGGAGTVFVEDVALGGAVRTVLTIDNANHGHKQVHEIDRHDVHHLNFAELKVVRTGIVRVHPAVQGIMVDVEKLTGDRTTTIHCFANQTWIFDPHDRRVQPPVDLTMEEQAEFVFAPHLLYAGTRTFEWRGRVTNVIDLDLTRGTTLEVFFSSERATRNLTSWETLTVDEPGTLKFATLNLHAESNLKFEAGMGMLANIEALDAKFGALIDASFVDVTIPLIDIEAESTLSAAGHRQLGDSPRGAGSFDGTSASGGGHGSPGGRGSQSVAGGAQYGDLYLPTQTGSRGGNSGGYGGGWMKLSSEYVVVDGLIDVSGQDSVPTRVSGAGSGGSLLIFTDHITGSGDLNVNGGRGLGARQGGGSGGRLAIHVPDAPVAFRGRYLAFGGSAAGSDTSLRGGAGSVYLEDKRAGKVFRQLRIDNQGWDARAYVVTEDTVGAPDKAYTFEQVHEVNRLSGGWMKLSSEYVVVDGLIDVSGQDSVPTRVSGAGSGGSLLIFTDHITGSGDLNVNGGRGLGARQGGGSGGRLAIHVPDAPVAFRGRYLAFGGSAAGSDTSLRGGAGSVYLEDKRAGKVFRQLRIDNQGWDARAYVVTEDTVGAPDKAYTFEQVHLLRRAAITLAPGSLNNVLTVFDFESDGDGLVLVGPGHRILSEVHPSEPSVAKPPVNFVLRNGGELVLPEQFDVKGNGVMVHGDDDERVAVDCNGTIIGAPELVLLRDVQMRVRRGCVFSFEEEGQLLYSSKPGEVQLVELELQTGAHLFTEPGLGFRALLDTLSLKPLSRITADYFDVNATTAHITAGARLSASGFDRRGVDVTQGPSVGTSASTGGSGGGHVNKGGASSTSDGGSAYGWLYAPTTPGSRGGDATSSDMGGFGGSTIVVRTDTLTLDGVLDVRGESPSSGSLAGAGSGGSVWVQTQLLYGDEDGVLDVRGGTAAASSAGSGSGGRVALFFDETQFRGSMNTHGGSGTSPGGPGSAYLRHQRTEFEVWETLVIDNNNHGWDVDYELGERDQLEYEFNEVHLVNHAALRLTDAAHRLVINKLIGDYTGFVHVADSDYVTVDVIPFRKSTARTPVNYLVDVGGELELADTTHLVGDTDAGACLALNGTLIGVTSLHLAPGREMELGVNVSTAFFVKSSTSTQPTLQQTAAGTL